MFPDRVSGLLLIDATPTTWPEAACAVPDDGSDVARIFHDSCTVYFHPDGNPERLDVPAAFAEVATITTLGQLPMIVVTADTKTYDGLDAGEAARLNDVWNEGQQRWAALSSVGQVVTVANTESQHPPRPASHRGRADPEPLPMTATEAAHPGITDSGHSPSNSITIAWGLIVGVANAAAPLALWWLDRAPCMPSPSP